MAQSGQMIPPPFVLKDLRGDNVTNAGWAILLPKPSFAAAPINEVLHKRYEVKRINHEEAYSLDGVCTNWAEEFFSRMRRAEIGHHHIAGQHLSRYAQEAA